MAYDKQLRRFFKIDFSKKIVVKGPDLAKDSSHQPIQIGQLNKNILYPPSLHWEPPQVKVSDKHPNNFHMGNKLEPIIPRSFFDPYAGPYLLVLDRTGRIDLLNRDTLEFAGTGGWLPAPETYFGTMPSVTPKDLLAYEVCSLTLCKFYREDGRLLKMTFSEPLDPEPAASRMEREYLGLFAAGVSRDGTAMAVAVFDAQWKRIKTEYTRQPKN